MMTKQATYRRGWMRAAWCGAVLLGMGAAIQPAHAQAAPTGLWLTANGNAVVAVTSCGGDLCGQIVGLVLSPGEPPPRAWNGAPQCGMTIFRTAPTAGTANAWSGTILDPRNGSHYGARLRVDESDRLELRGYVGLPLFGETQAWTRYRGHVPAGCRLRGS